MGTTMNDVVLAFCAGALRRYLKEKKKLPHKPLVAMVPISTRTEAEKDSTDNQVSSMLVQLATNIEDPIERLEAIHENTVRGKTYQKAIGAKTLRVWLKLFLLESLSKQRDYILNSIFQKCIILFLM